MKNLFDQISVNVSTGAIAYPKLPGFVLDIERVYRSAALFASHSPSVELALRHAIHEQVSAHHGASSLPGRLPR